LSPRAAISLAAVFLAAGDLRAGEPIDTDGPDFVESSEVVGRGRFQFEANIASERDRRHAMRRTTTSTPTLLRFGMTDTAEIRLETEGRIQVRNEATASEASSTEAGNADYALGVKWHSQDRDFALAVPAVSWIVHFDTPTGGKGFKGHGTRPSLRSVLTWDLPDGLALGLMPGLRYDATPDGHRFVSTTFGAVLSRRWSEHFRTFMESAAPQIASSRDGGC